MKAAENGDARRESSQVMYSVRTSTAGEFALNSVTGELHTVRPLDHESVQSPPVFTLVVCVYFDELSRSLLDCVNVTINVLDVNDNRPIVHQV